jgi:hypothetical protein
MHLFYSSGALRVHEKQMLNVPGEPADRPAPASLFMKNKR